MTIKAAGRNTRCPSAWLMENGAPDKVRTRDPLITNQVLYQLSYKGSARLISQARQKKSQKSLFGEDKPADFGDLQRLARHA
jgi:hypothetical protein